MAFGDGVSSSASSRLSGRIGEIGAEPDHPPAVAGSMPSTLTFVPSLVELVISPTVSKRRAGVTAWTPGKREIIGEGHDRADTVRALGELLQPYRGAGLIRLLIGLVARLYAGHGRGENAKRQRQRAELHQAHRLARRAGQALQGDVHRWGRKRGQQAQPGTGQPGQEAADQQADGRCEEQRGDGDQRILRHGRRRRPSGDRALPVKHHQSIEGDGQGNQVEEQALPERWAAGARLLRPVGQQRAPRQAHRGQQADQQAEQGGAAARR